uniref:DUF3362 domain-containing protein n=1 Tax=Echinostoma caproni TaxID=27848 RepID=A0A183AN85_9TREM
LVFLGYCDHDTAPDSALHSIYSDITPALGLDDVDILNFYRGRKTGYAMAAKERKSPCAPRKEKLQYFGETEGEYTLSEAKTSLDQINEQQQNYMNEDSTTNRIHKRGKGKKRTGSD